MAKQKRHINPSIKSKYIQSHRSQKDDDIQLDIMKEGIKNGDRYMLSRAITRIEKEGSEKDPATLELIEWASKQKAESFRIAVTGSPGVGKSTFIEGVGSYIVAKDFKMAVLAIDPSSKISKGSILGDKTRMEQLSKNESVFIRPSPAGKTLGGVARHTRETILLCEAAGYDVIIVETVGVGQSETMVHAMVDLFLLLLQPGEGDELQGIKKGIVELSDILIVNKADDGREKLALQTKQDYFNALHISNSKKKDWDPIILTCSSIDKAGMEKVWTLIAKFFAHLHVDDQLGKLRSSQNKYWFDNDLRLAMAEQWMNDPWILKERELIFKKIEDKHLTSWQGVYDLLENVKKRWDAHDV